MQTVKLFETAEMPDEVFAALREYDCFVEDGTSEYTVGFFMHDIGGECSEQQRARIQTVDKWFLDGGAQSRETVLIHHGTFDRFPVWLFEEEV